MKTFFFLSWECSKARTTAEWLKVHQNHVDQIFCGLKQHKRNFQEAEMIVLICRGNLYASCSHSFVIFLIQKHERRWKLTMDLMWLCTDGLSRHRLASRPRHGMTTSSFCDWLRGNGDDEIRRLLFTFHRQITALTCWSGENRWARGCSLRTGRCECCTSVSAAPGDTEKQNLNH